MSFYFQVQNNRDVRRNLHEYHFYPDSERYPDQDPAGSDDKRTREIRRLEKQMHKYLERLDELIQKVLQNIFATEDTICTISNFELC